MSSFEYRDSQIKAVSKVLHSLNDVNNIVLNGPTGCGKSGISYLLHEKMLADNPDHKTTIFCNQKLLQDQYADFLDDKDDVMVIKGKSNYLCFIDDNIKVDDAPCQQGIKCRFMKSCDYWQRRMLLSSKPLVIVNYHLALSLMDTPSGWVRESNLCIFDESHSLPSIITDYYKLSMSNTEVAYYDKLYKTLEKYKLSNIRDNIDSIMHSLSMLKHGDPISIARELFNHRNELLSSLSDLFGDLPLVIQKNKNLILSLSSLVTKETNYVNKGRHWIRLKESVKYVPDLQKIDEIVTFSLTPLKIDTIVDPLLKLLSAKRQFMSATIFPRVFMGYIGLKDDFVHIQLPSSFPISSRQVIFNPISFFNNLNLKTGTYEFNLLIDTVISILNLHSECNESGVIFTPSYRLASLIKTELESKAKHLGYTLLLNYNSDGRDYIVEKFRDTKVNKRLLISPSFSEGINFEDDISRFQIIVKSPFKSLGDAYVKEKLKNDKEWYELDCLMKIIQSLGRSCRNENDYCISYILDSSALKLYRQYINDIPRWFKESVTIIGN